MSGFERRVYGLVVRMHPAAFRNEFGREMMLDFEDARESHGLGALYWDAFVSLARQWGRGGLAAERGTMPRPSLLNGQYVMICQDEMTAFEFFRGLILSVTFLALCGFAEAHVTTTGAIPLAVNHMGPTSPQQGNSSAVGSTDGDDVAADVAGGGDRQPADKVAIKRSPENVAEEMDGEISSNAGGLPVADSVTPIMDGASSDAQSHAAVVSGLGRGVAVHGQILHASGPLPSFEVVSIRPWRPAPSPPPPSAGATVPRRERFAPGPVAAPKTDRVRMILPTKMLIASAYDLPFGFEKHILGGSGWLDSDQYEIQAKIEDSQFAAMQKMTQAQQREQVALMEQSLLADRFKMKVHFETREMPVYALVVGKGGAKLTPAKEGGPHSLSIIDVEQGLQMKAVGITLDQWIQSPFLGGRMVVDQTGLKGAYDFTLTWGREQPVVSDAGQGSGVDAPLLPTAVQEQLGLKLVPTKGQVEVIVIDHIERPSAN